MTDINAGDHLNFGYTHYGDGSIKSITGDIGPTLTDLIETYEYVPGTNRLLKITRGAETTDISYDLNGNTTQMGDKTFIYNQNQRLIEVAENTDTLGEYTYNGKGQRIIKEAGGTTTIYHYDVVGNLIAEGVSDGTITSEYIYMGGYRLAKINSATGDAYYYLNDHIGTPRKMMDESGAVVWAASYSPFGEAHVEPSSTIENRFRFSGQYYDQETGLHYNYFRYYNPQTGRYLEADPIGLRGGLNLYTYTSNDPANGVDPYGLTKDSDRVAYIQTRVRCCHSTIGFPGCDEYVALDMIGTLKSVDAAIHSICASICPQVRTDYGVDHYSESPGWEAGSLESMHKSVTPIRYAMGAFQKAAPTIVDGAKAADTMHELIKADPKLKKCVKEQERLGEQFRTGDIEGMLDGRRTKALQEGNRTLLKIINPKFQTPDPKSEVK